MASGSHPADVLGGWRGAYLLRGMDWERGAQNGNKVLKFPAGTSLLVP